MPEDKNETIKEALFRITRRETIQLLEKVITHNLIKWLAIGWLFISVATSIYRRIDNKCHIVVPLDSYFYAKAICPVNAP